MTKAELFRSLHRAPPLLVLPNAWDVASAKAFATLPGCRALATSSAAVARSLGHKDRQRAPATEMIEVAARIAAAVDLPVTADLEAGYGDPPGTAAAALAAGAAGMNLEDSRGLAMVPVDEQVTLIRAVRAASPELVVNARVDVFVRQTGGVEEAVARGNAYLAAGADCVYPIMAPFDAIGPLAAGIDGPVNVIASPQEARLEELERLGVTRVTFGSGLAAAALGEATRLTELVLSR